MFKRKFKLLTKTTFVYLCFTFITFLISALFLTDETNELIEEELNGSFSWYERRAISSIQRHGEPSNRKFSYKAYKIEPEQADISFQADTDTTIYNQEQEYEMVYQKRIKIIEVDGNYFRLEMLKSVEEINQLKDDIFGSLIPAFIILAFVIVLFNYFLAGYLFRPFNKILEQMKKYQIGKGVDIEKVETSTTEFDKMQQLYHTMIKRTEKEYEFLKEYTENMAHEIQTPLTVIRNKTENLIASEEIMANVSDQIKSIYAEANHLSKLGAALNLLTKIEHGEFSNKKIVETKSRIENHINNVKELAELKSIGIEVKLNVSNKINIDPILFDIIIKNLLRNALSYTPEGGNISIESSSSILKFSNEGAPLEFEEEKIFDRFAKNYNSHNSVGLGLALVSKICEMNELKISYEYNSARHVFTITKQ